MTMDTIKIPQAQTLCVAKLKNCYDKSNNHFKRKQMLLKKDFYLSVNTNYYLNVLVYNTI